MGRPDHSTSAELPEAAQDIPAVRARLTKKRKAPSNATAGNLLSKSRLTLRAGPVCEPSFQLVEGGMTARYNTKSFGLVCQLS